MEDLHKIWPHRWLSPKTECKKSKIHGWGIFAKELIKKDETVSILGGIIVPKKDILRYREKIGHLGLQISDDFFICPTSRDEAGENGTLNHSCDSNCGIKDSIRFVAVRDIKAGEELTADEVFSETFFDPFECNCGADNCRKIIKPDDWKLPELQKKYKGYFSSYLERK